MPSRVRAEVCAPPSGAPFHGAWSHGTGREIADPRVVRAMRMAEASPEVPIAAVSLARAVGLSQFHFARRFRDHVGETLNAYGRRVRLDGAAIRLRWTDEPILSIALAAGYGSQAAFTRAFTAHTRLSPAEYRRSNLRACAASDAADGLHAVRVRRLEANRYLARRYLGADACAPERWRHFLAQVPATFARIGAPRYLGIAYDHPCVTPPDRMRHDCCLLIPPSLPFDADLCAARGFHIVEVGPGLYASNPCEGAAGSVRLGYDPILDRWLPDHPRYRLGGDVVALEVHAEPPGSVPTHVAREILVPLRSNAEADMS